MNDKFISIIVPCYNVEKYVSRCIESLIGQTIGVDKLEIILVDDASTDGTLSVLQKYEQKYSESVLIVHYDENMRSGGARNIGLQYATAPFIGFVDSDDWVELDMFERLYNKIIEHQCDIVMCDNWRDFDDENQLLAPRDNGKGERVFLIDSEEKRKTLIACGSLEFGVWNKLYSRHFLVDNNIVFPEKLAYEDHYFGALLYFYVKKFCVIGERLYHYYVNPDSIVLSTDKPYHFDILKVDLLLWDELSNRDLDKLYKEEIEYLFLTLCYLMSMKMIILRLNSIPYDYFIKLKNQILQRIPDYSNNKYIDDFITEPNKIILELLKSDISQEELAMFCREVRKNVESGKFSL